MVPEKLKHCPEKLKHRWSKKNREHRKTQCFIDIFNLRPANCCTMQICMEKNENTDKKAPRYQGKAKEKR